MASNQVILTPDFLRKPTVGHTQSNDEGGTSLATAFLSSSSSSPLRISQTANKSTQAKGKIILLLLMKPTL